MPDFTWQPREQRQPLKGKVAKTMRRHWEEKRGGRKGGRKINGTRGAAESQLESKIRVAQKKRSQEFSSGNIGVRYWMKNRIFGGGFHTWTVSVQSEDGRFVSLRLFYCTGQSAHPRRASPYALTSLPHCEQVVLCIVGQRRDNNTNSKMSRGSTGMQHGGGISYGRLEEMKTFPRCWTPRTATVKFRNEREQDSKTWRYKTIVSVLTSDLSPGGTYPVFIRFCFQSGVSCVLTANEPLQGKMESSLDHLPRVISTRSFLFCIRVRLLNWTELSHKRNLQYSSECFAYERKTHREEMRENLAPEETEPITRECEMSSKNSFPPLK